MSEDRVQRVAKALYLNDRAPMTRPGNIDYDAFSKAWDERHASGNSRVSANYRYEAVVAIDAYEGGED